MLKLKNISKTYNKLTPSPLVALDSVSLSLSAGSWTYVIGGNGSGKSTLLKIINKELAPDIGEILFTHENDVVYIDQSTIKNLIPSMTVYENLLFGLTSEGMHPNLTLYSQKTFRSKISYILKDFDISMEKRLDEQVRFLSGGEQQLIVAARIILSRPRTILMDEFTSSLDQKWAPLILNKLKQFATANNALVIAVTHDFSQIRKFGDRLVLLHKGQVKADYENSEFDFSPPSVLKLFYEQN
jgi:putative tryptophan/tyrosine transport system ATP-binding protein